MTTPTWEARARELLESEGKVRRVMYESLRHEAVCGVCAEGCSECDSCNTPTVLRMAELLEQESCAFLSEAPEAGGDVPQDIARDAVEVCRRVKDAGSRDEWSDLVGCAQMVVERMEKR